MSEKPRFYITTAIDYPNSRPHIGTAFEKIGADVQARYRRMNGYDVFFLMGNDENTIKVSKRAAELGKDPQAYCNDMAQQFKDVWKALDISFDEFIQTSEPRHHAGCRDFIQRVFAAGWIYKGSYEGLYCEGCESFKTEKEINEAGGICPNHRTPPAQRTEPCYYFALSKFQDKLLQFYEAHPDFIQPVSRRNEVVSLVREGLLDVNITRSDQAWGIRVPFDEQFTIYVWFDALLNYVTGIGYGTDQAKFAKWWPADIHFIGKDITRFHCALWPAMLMAAGLPLPKQVFGHGFVYVKNESTGIVEKISKSLGNVVEPMEIISKFSGEAFRYYFMRECPFPGDGEFSFSRFAEVFNAELANNLGNLYSRCVTLITKNYAGELPAVEAIPAEFTMEGAARADTVRKVAEHIEACEYNLALQTLWQQVLDPANRYADRHEPWKKVKVDRAATAHVLRNMVDALRVAAILLKPFLPRSAEKIYRSFNFPERWETVAYAHATTALPTQAALQFVGALDANGKVPPMFPRVS